MIQDTALGRRWEATAIPGLQISTAWRAENGDGGYFAQFKAGTRFPLHDHDGWEQILVIAGRIRFNDTELAEGDYLKVGSGEQHEALAIEDTHLFVAHCGGIQVLA